MLHLTAPWKSARRVCHHAPSRPSNRGDVFSNASVRDRQPSSRTVPCGIMSISITLGRWWGLQCGLGAWLCASIWIALFGLHRSRGGRNRLSRFRRRSSFAAAPVARPAPRAAPTGHSLHFYHQLARRICGLRRLRPGSRVRLACRSSSPRVEVLDDAPSKRPRGGTVTARSSWCARVGRHRIGRHTQIKKGLTIMPRRSSRLVQCAGVRGLAGSPPCADRFFVRSSRVSRRSALEATRRAGSFVLRRD